MIGIFLLTELFTKSSKDPIYFRKPGIVIFTSSHDKKMNENPVASRQARETLTHLCRLSFPSLLASLDFCTHRFNHRFYEAIKSVPFSHCSRLVAPHERGSPRTGPLRQRGKVQSYQACMYCQRGARTL